MHWMGMRSTAVPSRSTKPNRVKNAPVGIVAVLAVVVGVARVVVIATVAGIAVAIVGSVVTIGSVATTRAAAAALAKQTAEVFERKRKQIRAAC